MKKPIEKRIVQIEATRQWIEGYGWREKSNKLAKWFTVGWVGGLILMLCLVKWSVAVYIIGVLLIGAWGLFYHICNRAGKKLWKDIKDREQPIKL